MLVSEAPEIRREALIEAAQRERLPELAIPRDIIAAVTLPLLGSGKTDYPAVTRLAATAAESGADSEAATRRRELKCSRNGAEKRPEAFVRSCEMR